jgi:hypothetical protein
MKTKNKVPKFVEIKNKIVFFFKSFDIPFGGVRVLRESQIGT